MAPVRLALTLLLALPAWAAPEAPDTDPVAERGRRAPTAEDAEEAEEVAEPAAAGAEPEAAEDAEADGDVEAPEKSGSAEDAAEDGAGEDGATDDGDEGAAPEGGKKKRPTADPEAAFVRGDYPAARDGFRAQVKATPDAPGLRYRLAVSAALAQDLRLAEDQAAHAERLDPGNPAATQLAFAAHKSRIINEKLETDRALTAARTALADGRLRTAERLAGEALATAQPAQRAALQRVRGQALLALGKGSAAVQALKAAVGGGQHDPALWLTLGDAAAEARDIGAARAFYTLAVEAAAPSHPVGVRARAALAALPTREAAAEPAAEPAAPPESP